MLVCMLVHMHHMTQQLNKAITYSLNNWACGIAVCSRELYHFSIHSKTPIEHILVHILYKIQ